MPACAGKVVPDPEQIESPIGQDQQQVRPPKRGGGHGLTFGSVEDAQIGPGEVHMSCHAAPRGIDNPWRDSCNPYTGDTACTEARPILCVRMDGSPEPQNLTFNFYNGWVPGVLSSTSPVVGTRLTSLAVADAICADELGQGFRMAAFHDANGNGGWTFTGKRGKVDEQQRNWVHIGDQPGNCWD